MTPAVNSNGIEDRVRTRWSVRHPAQAAAAYSLSYLAIGGVAAWLAAQVTAPGALLALVTAVGTLTLGCCLLLVLSVCRISMQPKAEAAWMLLTMLLFCLARPNVFAVLGRQVGAAGMGSRMAELVPTFPGEELVGNMALVLWAIFLGRLVSRVIREGKLLLPVAVVASVMDVITVFWGVVAKITEEAPAVAVAFSASAPLLPPPDVAAPILGAVGIGDFLFLALFLTVTLRHSMNVVQAMWATFAAMLVAGVGFFLWPEVPGMPGLPFISVAVLATNWRYLKYSRQEKTALALAGVFLAALGAGVWAIVRR